nr:MAG TPA: L-alanine exporter [Ackermannviridae sp.]
MIFILVVVVIMIITSRSYGEWKDKIDNMEE